LHSDFSNLPGTGTGLEDSVPDTSLGCPEAAQHTGNFKLHKRRVSKPSQPPSSKTAGFIRYCHTFASLDNITLDNEQPPIRNLARQCPLAYTTNNHPIRNLTRQGPLAYESVLFSNGFGVAGRNTLANLVFTHSVVFELTLPAKRSSTSSWFQVRISPVLGYELN
jgi:hypothetical protein